MGPFELMDLIGIDVNFAVARSFWEQSFGEPRWRPSPIHERMVASGRLGRKTGRGFYSYEQGTLHRPRDPSIEGERPILDEDELERVAGPIAPAILTRLASTIANEACFALGERVASEDDINTAMRLGYNWPIGPLEWAERLGWSRGARSPRGAARDAGRGLPAGARASRKGLLNLGGPVELEAVADTAVPTKECRPSATGYGAPLPLAPEMTVP